MLTKAGDLPILEFKSAAEMRAWLLDHHASSSGIESLTFPELLDEGLCFGWSESTRQAFDEISYLQIFTPRRVKGTASERNRRRVEELIRSGRMTRAGLDALK